jgi:hypothetical protein
VLGPNVQEIHVSAFNINQWLLGISFRGQVRNHDDWGMRSGIDVPTPGVVGLLVRLDFNHTHARRVRPSRRHSEVQKPIREFHVLVPIMSTAGSLAVRVIDVSGVVTSMHECSGKSFT